MRLHFLLSVLFWYFLAGLTDLWTHLLSAGHSIRTLKKTSEENKKGAGDWEKSSQWKQKAYKRRDTSIWCKGKSDGQKKKTKKIVFARGLMGLMVITKCLLYQEQEKDISANENAKLD